MSEDKQIDIKTGEVLPPLSLKEQTLALLKREGITLKEASKALGISEGYTRQLSAKLNKYDLTSKKSVKSAHNAVQKLVNGEKFGDIKDIKDSTVLSAAKMIFDRAQPIVQRSERVDVKVSFIQESVPLDALE